MNRIRKEDLERCYFKEQKSIDELKKNFGIGYEALSKLFKEYNLNKRTKSEAVKLWRLKKILLKLNLNKEQLKDKLGTSYLKEKLSIEKTAEKLGISRSTVESLLKEFRIKTRNWKEAYLVKIERGDYVNPMKGKHNLRKEGRIKHHGYILIFKPDHPRASKDGYVREHLLIWEEFHKKAVPARFIIHHLNGVKDDNRPENLVAINPRNHSTGTLREILQARIRRLETLLKLSEFPDLKIIQFWFESCRDFSLNQGHNWCEDKCPLKQKCNDLRIKLGIGNEKFKKNSKNT